MKRHSYYNTLHELESEEKTLTIHPVDYYLIDKNAYSFHLYATYRRNEKTVLTELYYNLRYNDRFIKRNGREVKFNKDNLDTIIPRQKDFTIRENGEFYSKKNTTEFLNMVEMEENKGIYGAMLHAIGGIGEERTYMTSRAFIRLIDEYHKMELVYKALGVPINPSAKMLHLVMDASTNNVKKLHQIFGLTKKQFNFLRELAQKEDGGFNWNLFLKQHEFVIFLDNHDIDYLRGFYETIDELEEKYNLSDKRSEFMNYNGKPCDYKNKTRGFFSLKQKNPHGINERRLLEYLLFECDVSQGMKFREAFMQYKDYFDMCSDMNYERFDRYPKALKTQHDIVSRNYRLVKDEVEAEKFRNVAEEYKNMEAAQLKGGYSVVVPTTAQDLVKEGNALSHCIASYVPKITKRQTKILFLRLSKESDEPLVTVEINNDELTQARGQNNRRLSKEEHVALTAYAKRKRLEMSVHI